MSYQMSCCYSLDCLWVFTGFPLPLTLVDNCISRFPSAVSWNGSLFPHVFYHRFLGKCVSLQVHNSFFLKFVNCSTTTHWSCLVSFFFLSQCCLLGLLLVISGSHCYSLWWLSLILHEPPKLTEMAVTLLRCPIADSWGECLLSYVFPATFCSCFFWSTYPTASHWVGPVLY